MRSNEENGENPLILKGTDLLKKNDSFCWFSIGQYDFTDPWTWKHYVVSKLRDHFFNRHRVTFLKNITLLLYLRIYFIASLNVQASRSKYFKFHFPLLYFTTGLLEPWSGLLRLLFDGDYMPEDRKLHLLLRLLWNVCYRALAVQKLWMSSLSLPV